MSEPPWGFVHGPGQFALRRGHLLLRGFNVPGALHPVNYRAAVLIDPDDLIDSRQVAELLGLSSHRAVSVYRSRYEDFPTPVVVRSEGQCVLWHRPELDMWIERHRG